jgi:O-antigen ligase
VTPSLDRRTIVPWGLFVVLAGLTLANGGRYIGAQALAQIALGGLLLLTILLPATRRFPWWGPLTAVAAVSLASTVPSVNQLASIEELCRWTACLAVGWMAWRTVDDWRRAHLSLALVALGTLAAAGGLVDVMVRHEPVAASFFARSNDLAAFLLLTIPLTVVLTAAETRAWRRIGSFAFAVQVLAFMLTQSRAAILALGVGIAYLLVASAGAVRRRMVAGTLGVGLVGLLVGAPYLPSVLARFTRLIASLSGAGNETSTPWRQALWRAAARMGLDHPLLGTGPGTYASASRAYQDTAGYYSINAHNFYAQTFGEMGALGLAAWAALLIGVLWAIRQALREPADQRAPQMALSAGLIASLLHIAFDLDWSVLAIPIAFWLVAGMLLSAVVPAEETEDAGRLSRVIRLAVALVLIVVPARSSIGLRLIVRADRLAAGNQIGEALAMYDKAQRALPWHSASVASSRSQMLVALGRTAEAEAAVDEASRLDSLNGAYALQKAQLRASRQDWQGAVTAGERAISLNPYRHPLPYLVLARWYDRLQRPDVAMTWLTTGEHRFPLGNLQAYQTYTPGDRYELYNLLLAKATLAERLGRKADAVAARQYAATVVASEQPDHGLPAALSSPLQTIRTYWAAYDAKKPLSGALPGAPVPPPPAGLPAGEPRWFWLERDITRARVIYERPGVPARLVDELEMRDAGWMIVRRSGQSPAGGTP